MKQITQVNEIRNMLQPREQLCVNRKRQKVVRTTDWNWVAKQPPPLAILVAAALLCCCGAFPVAFAQYIDDAAYRVDPTPALQTVREDLTTVVLVNNGNNGRSSIDYHGRHLNFRPEIGLLTSTARTFIQEGVTTEYATQVVGTTLDNGRIYAQYLKKSSRVLYDAPASPSVVTSWVGESTSLLQNHNDLLNADLPDWGDIDDRLQLQRNSFVGNTDYIGYNERLLGANSASKAELGAAFVLATPVANEAAAPTKLAPLPKADAQGGGEAVAANKVLPAGDLPTYTVTNTFSPSGVSLDSVYSRKYPLAKSGASSSFSSSSSSSSSKDATRSPKVIYKQLLLNSGNIDRLNEFGHEYTARTSVPAIPLFRSFSTVTYYGFAEFTTTVGDSVIVFSPSTSANAMHKGQVTSIKGEATLEVSATKSVDFATVAPTKVAQSPLVTQFALEDALPTAEPERDSSAQTEAVTASEEPPVAVAVRVSLTESSADRPESMLSRPTGDEVLKIYSSLAKANADTASITSTSTTSTATSSSATSEPTIVEIAASTMGTPVQTTTHGGATTIFFEDDPFENFLEPTEVLTPIATPSAAQSIESTSEVVRSTAIASSIPVTPVEPDAKPAPAQTTEGPDAEDSDLETTTMAAATTTTDEEADQTTDITTDTAAAAEADATESPAGESAAADPEYTVREINADNEHDLDPNCIRTSQVFLTQLPKTITQLTTFLIANELAATSETSISTNLIPSFEISQATKHYCIQATATSTLPQPATTAAATTSFSSSTSSSDASTTTEPTTEPPPPSGDASKKTNEIDVEQEAEQEQVSEATPHTDEPIDSSEIGDGDEPEGDAEADDEADSGEEIELLYKTLYTTYTYLTTFFHEDTTSISSHTEVVTNVITSTLGAAGEVAGYEEGASSTEQPDIAPTKTAAAGAATSKFMVPQELESLIRDGETDDSDAGGDVTRLQSAEGVHLDASEQPLTTTRTYYTTYTYYTTIFAEGETELMSRTEVYTNLVVDSSDIAPTKVAEGEATGLAAVASAADPSVRPVDSVAALPSASDTQSLTTSLPDLSEYSQMVTLVTDVRSSSSNGEQQIINRSPIQGRQNDPNRIVQQQGPIDDQISSETNTGDINIESIEPSATLLLQTSFTTFTYYTTMYNGDNTNVISRLETITNVVTETLQPTKTAAANVNDDATLPITYYTTYTYWTKLAKDGDIQTISREETISNVVTPTNANQVDGATSAAADPASPLAALATTTAQNPNPVAVTSVLEPTTFYTTYTFYTTSYEVDQTITDSRFETVTNVVTPTITLENSLQSSSSPSVTDTATDSPISGLATPTAAEPPLVLYDYKKIIDADGVSTLHFTTQISSTVGADGSPSQVVSSTSSLHIDEEKRSVLSTAPAPSATAEPETVTEVGSDGQPTVVTVSATTLSSRQYKTGLVRLIEGTRIANLTTTLYQSKVIGTFIDNRYAQIIESTSSFLFNTLATAVPPPADGEAAISPSTVQAAAIDITASPTANTLGGAQVSLVEGSIDNQEATTEPVDIEGDENEEGEEDGDDKARYPAQSRKRTFTPVIRPFASRNRPQFAPKKKAGSPSSATIITRSDFTPTITATPALKSNVVGSSRRGGLNSLSGSFGSSSSRRFGRPSSKILQSSGAVSPTASSPLGSSRGRLSNTARLSLGSSLKRASNSQIRPSSSNFRGGLSSGFGGNSRLRIRPTGSFGFGAGQQTASGGDGLAVAPPAGDNSVEPIAKQSEADDGDEESREEVTTENSKLNSLNRFRRPPLNRPSGFVPAGGARPTAASGGFSLRRNPLTGRAKATSTTTTTTTTTSRPRSFQRPTIGSFQNRARPQNSLFPPRGLFQATKNTTAQSEDAQKQGQGGDDDSDYDEEDEDEDAEGDEEGDDETNEDATKRRRRSESRSNRRQLAQKANEVKRRVRREAEADTTSSQTRTNFRNRFRRPPKAAQPAADVEEPTTDAPAPPPARGRSRIGSRFGSATSAATTTTAAASSSEGHGRAIRPTRPSSGRAQFTLREKDSAAPRKGSAVSFPRRPQTSPPARRKTSGGSTSGVGGSRRLKSFSSGGGANEAPARSTANSRGRTLNNANGNGRNRATVRSRNNHHRNDYGGGSDAGFAAFDGTITVTHVTPAEVTIPVVNGKITEYKNVVTAKTSTEVLGPKQYTTLTGSNGMETLVLTRHESSVNYAGATEVTQYILHETPTTTVTFTPTTIRGRKTSFSHVIPSTVYSVETVVSTSQPQLAANAPLANILLSQLLLGNIGLPANPLVGGTAPPLGGVVQPPVQATPVTEYRTHTSTYVTTVVEGMSTILPITFMGKKILTTVYDTTANTITATEFITDTIVTTPTQVQQQQQQPAVNSLLLQQFLLQQQLQPQLLDPLQQQQQPQQILNSAPPQLQLLADSLQDLDTNHIQHHSSEHIDSDDIPIVGETQTHKSGRKKSRKGAAGSGKRNKKHQNNNSNNNNNRHRDEDESASVITLYVSGRRPGEFSTILSTVQASGSVYKREAAPSSVPIGAGMRTAAATDGDRDVYETNGSEFVSEYLMPTGGDGDSAAPNAPFQVRLFESQPFDETNLVEEPLAKKDSQTQTLESIVGDVNLWYTVQVQEQQQQHRDLKTTKQSGGDGRSVSALAADPDIGVFIVPLPADTAIQPTSSHFFACPANNSPLNLSTAQAVAIAAKDSAGPPDNSYDEARHNLATRVMSNGVEVIIASDKSKVPEEKHYSAHKPSTLRADTPVTLAASTLKNQMILIVPPTINISEGNFTIPIDPNQFITKTCLTTYTYRTTYMQDGKTTLESREKVISNIATEERNYIKMSLSQGFTLSQIPSLATATFPTTYSYFNTILDGELPIVVTSDHTVVNTVTGPEDYIAFLQPSEEATPVYNTNTYYSQIALTKTLPKKDTTHEYPHKSVLITSMNSVTQVIVTESLPGRSESTSVSTSYYAYDIEEESVVEDTGAPHPSRQDLGTSIDDYNIRIYATKTYQTTFTYMTTSLISSEPGAPPSSTGGAFQAPLTAASPTTLLSYRTRIIENVITEAVPGSALPEALIVKLRKDLRKRGKNQSGVIVTMATLDGQVLEITAMKMLAPSVVSTAIASTPSASIDPNAHEASRVPPKDSENSKVEVVGAPPTGRPEEPVSGQSSGDNDSVPDAEDAAGSESQQSFVYLDVPPLNVAATDAPPKARPLKSNKTHKTRRPTAAPPTKVSPAATKVAQIAGTPVSPNTNPFMGSLYLKRLNALKPMLSAVAGLIQSNLAATAKTTPLPQLHRPTGAASHEARQPSAAPVNTAAAQSAPNSEKPIYIPVKNAMVAGEALPPNEYNNIEGLRDEPQLFSQSIAQSLHINPPAMDDVPLGDENWMFFQQEQSKANFPAQPQHSLAYDSPMRSGGIPIRPGEVINANSDIVLGKPNGLQLPRVPELNSLQWPGPSRNPYGAELSNANVPAESVLFANDNHPNTIPLNERQQQIQNIENYDSILQPPPLPTYAASHGSPMQPSIPLAQVRHNKKQGMLQDPMYMLSPPPPPRSPHLTPQPSIPPTPMGAMSPPLPVSLRPTSSMLPPLNYMLRTQPQAPYTPANVGHPVTFGYTPEQQVKHKLNQDLRNSEILEIKPIPEIFSLHLPAVTNSTNYVTYTHYGLNQTHPLATLYDPPKYPAQHFATAPAHQHPPQEHHHHPAPQRHASTNHQRINLDTHVLSHNVDIHVPPLTFNKDDVDHPSSVGSPVRGHFVSPAFHPPSQASVYVSALPTGDGVGEQAPGSLHPSVIAQIKIPVNEKNVEVNLTPQNVVGSVKTSAHADTPQDESRPVAPDYGGHRTHARQPTDSYRNRLPTAVGAFHTSTISGYYDRPPAPQTSPPAGHRISNGSTLNVPQRGDHRPHSTLAEAHPSEVQLKVDRPLLIPLSPKKNDKSKFTAKQPSHTTKPPGSVNNLIAPPLPRVPPPKQAAAEETGGDPDTTGPEAEDQKTASTNYQPHNLHQSVEKHTHPGTQSTAFTSTKAASFFLKTKGSPFKQSPGHPNDHRFDVATSNAAQHPPAHIFVATGESFRIADPNHSALEDQGAQKVERVPSKAVASSAAAPISSWLVPTKATPNQAHSAGEILAAHESRAPHTTTPHRTVAIAAEAKIKDMRLPPLSVNRLSMDDLPPAQDQKLFYSVASAPAATATQQHVLGMHPPPPPPPSPSPSAVTLNTFTTRPPTFASANRRTPPPISSKNNNAWQQNNIHRSSQPMRSHGSSTSLVRGRISPTAHPVRFQSDKASATTASTSRFRTTTTGKPTIVAATINRKNLGASSATHATATATAAKSPPGQEDVFSFGGAATAKTPPHAVYSLEASEVAAAGPQQSGQQSFFATPTLLRATEQRHSQPEASEVATLKRIVLPTRYITNTMVLTVTTTATRLLTAKGGRVATQWTVLTKTHTATVLDTVTHTQTMLQPTHITESHIILATTTATTTATATATATATSTATATTTETETRTKTETRTSTKTETEVGKPPSAASASTPTTKIDIKPTVVIEVANVKDAWMTQTHTEVASEANEVDDGPHYANHKPHAGGAIKFSTASKEGTLSAPNESIFIVMTDHKPSRTAAGNGTAYNVSAPADESRIDYDENISFDVAARDEEAASPGAGLQTNRIHLGGVLIDSPPQSNELPEGGAESNKHAAACRPACKSLRNEVCVDRPVGLGECQCRPGFARMFPDRPCKPTYSYAVQLHADRLGRRKLSYHEKLAHADSEDFRNLAGAVHDAVDRMIMQSDFRDVYHGVQLMSFQRGAKSRPNVAVNLLLQLSDNGDEKRLEGVLKKYLRIANFSIGGTELHTDKEGIESLQVTDFDECKHDKFHDCSQNAKCFNLPGTYTCSCVEGYADQSENAVYPGRVCSAEVIGCSRCHYHGKCALLAERDFGGQSRRPHHLPNDTIVCECFTWYTGATCQLNLKILLISLIAIGTILFILLLFCLLITCVKRHHGHLSQRLTNSELTANFGDIHGAQFNTTDRRSKRIGFQKKRTMLIRDSSSESSQNSLPYVIKSATRETAENMTNVYASKCMPDAAGGQHQHQHKYLVSGLRSFEGAGLHYAEQSDRSLTVMIPRAKYHHPSVLPQTQLMHHQLTLERVDKTNSRESSEAVTTHEQDPGHKHSAGDAKHHQTDQQSKPSRKGSAAKHTNPGALVSAGFEVSATVTAEQSRENASTDDSRASNNFYDTQMGTAAAESVEAEQQAASKTDFEYNVYPGSTTTFKCESELIKNMDVWLDNVKSNELSAEARSFDETTVHATTRVLGLSYDNRTINTNDEANTMAERDVGSTFLLPHTHLYKTERESDISGFDSF